MKRKKAETSPKQLALARYVWFLFSLVLLILIHAVIYPDFIRFMANAGQPGGGATTDFMLQLAENLHRYWQAGLAPAILATIIWLSPMDREKVARVLFAAAAIVGLLMMAGSIALFLAYLG